MSTGARLCWNTVARGLGGVVAITALLSLIPTLAATGPPPAYLTFMGGNSVESFEVSTALDASGRILVAGSTLSSNLPLSEFPFQSVYRGHPNGFFGIGDGYIARFDPAGTTLQYSTFIGGSGDDDVKALLPTPDGDVIAVGLTNSGDFPRLAGTTPPIARGRNAFVARLRPSSGGITVTSLQTFPNFYALDARLASDGGLWIVGEAGVEFHGTPGAFRTSINPGTLGGVVVKLAPDLNTISAATFLGGGSGITSLRCVSAAPDGSVVVGGFTVDPTLPTVEGAIQRTYAGGNADGVLARFDSTLTALQHCTYVGGNSGEFEYVRAIHVSPSGRTAITGRIARPVLPVSADSFQQSFSGGASPYLMLFSALPAAAPPYYSTYIGGHANGYGGFVTSQTIDEGLATVVSGGTLVGSGFPQVDAPVAPAASSIDQGFVTTFIEAPGERPRVTRSYCFAPVTWSGCAVDRFPGKFLFAGIDSLLDPGLPLQPGAAFGRRGGQDHLFAHVVAFGSGFPVPLIQSAQFDLALLGLKIVVNSGPPVEGAALVVERRKVGDTPFTLVRTLPPGENQLVDFDVSRAESYQYRCRLVRDTDVSQYSPLTTVPKPTDPGGRVKLQPASLDFKTVKLRKSAKKSVTLSNSGRGSLSGRVLLPLAPFALLGGERTFTLAPKKTLKLDVSVTPTTAGAASSTLTIYSDDPTTGLIRVPLKVLGR